MGNVSASMSMPAPAPPPPPGATLLPPPPPPTPGQTDAAATTQGTDQGGPNGGADDGHPGTMEDLHKKCKEIFPVNFEGGRLIINKGLNNHFQISHTLNMGSLSPCGYRFGATYVGHKQFGADAFPVLLGDIDPSGNVNANIYYQWTPSIKSRFVSQIQNSRFQSTQLTVDHRGKDYTASFSLANVDMVNESGLGIMQYLQSVTKGLDLGAEIIYQCGPHVPGREMAIMSGALRYSASDYVLSTSLGMDGLHACFYQKCSDQLQVGVELEAGFRMREVSATLGYLIDIPKANATFKGMIDSNWTIGAVLEKKLLPLPFTFMLSGMLNHNKNQFRLGAGLIIG